MPPKGSTGTTRRKPLRDDRGVKLFAPTPAKPRFRVVAAGRVERTSAAIPIEAIGPAAAVGFEPAKLIGAAAWARQEADELFDETVRWAKEQVSVATRGERTMNALCDRRLEELRTKNRARGTITKASELMDLYVRPQIGTVEVRAWSDEHCRAVMQAAQRTCGSERLQDLGALLRSLVTLAHRKPLWLSRGEDPMEGIEYSVKATTQGVGVRFVPPKERPSTAQVDALALAMQARGEAVMHKVARYPNAPQVIDRGWGWLFTQAMGKCGCRLGEAMGLTVASCCRPRPEVEGAIGDEHQLTSAQRAQRLAGIIALPHGFAIDPGRRVITVTEVVEWTGTRPFVVPATIRSSGKVPKSRKQRWTIYPMSMLDPIVSRCFDLLTRFGPGQGPAALLFPAHGHDFVQVPVDPKKPKAGTRWQDQDWWDRSLMRRSMYLPAVERAEHWPDVPPFPMENLRHHFATWAKKHGYPDELVTHCMGHSSVAYTQARYFRTGADSIPQGMAASDSL